MQDVIITDALSLIAECQAPEVSPHARLIVSSESLSTVYVYCYACLQQPELLKELSWWLASKGPPYLLSDNWNQYPEHCTRCAWCLKAFPRT